TVATATPALPIVAQARPELMTEGLDATPRGMISEAALDRALDLAEDRDGVVLGPGLGQDPSTQKFIRAFVQHCAKPMIIDADGLNAFAMQATNGDTMKMLRRCAPTVLTPHPGEMARLIGETNRQNVLKQRVDLSRKLASEIDGVVVLKGQRTLIAEASGRMGVNPTGNPGMATAGTGDVLAGLVGALIAREHSAWLAATAAVYLHGMAGDCAMARMGPESLTAGDILACLPEAIRKLIA
ncbi:MAG: NAD(P)H-hydrate dehydratase, partial [Vicinamibacteria bacterium]|nr:NAD(P)H-hydrate dehydratase [Vicinamibacteria bacterium]